MKHKILYLLIAAFFVGISACEKENNDTVFPQIGLQYNNTIDIKLRDTVRFSVEYYSCKAVPGMTVTVNGQPANLLTKEVTDHFEIIIPAIIDEERQLIIEIYHPDDIVGTSNIFLQEQIEITNFYPLSGKGGDEITIRGFDLLNDNSDTKIILNTLSCETKILTDTMITAIVPNGCGTGKIKISSKDTILLYDKIFTYNFNHKEQIIKSYLRYGTEFSIERDAQNRVNKIIEVEDPVEYREFIYNSDGLLDTIYEHYSWTTYIYTYKYLSDGTMIIGDEYRIDYQGEKTQQKTHEYNLLNDEIVSHIIEAKSENTGSYFVYETYYFYYFEDYIREEGKRYNDDGSINTYGYLDISFDKYNKVANLDIPGYVNEFNYNRSGFDDTEFTYNEFGNLEKEQHIFDGTLRTPYIYYYE